jgi:signal transduction histidine kinase/DNA-binding response OmpR family regulator
MQKILVVNDNVEELLATKALLSSILDESLIITASSGKEALSKSVEMLPDVIVINILLFGKSSTKIIEEIRKIELISSVPVLIIAGKDSSTEMKIDCLNAGADSIISQPLNIAELSAQIKAMLRIKRLETRLEYEKENLKSILLDLHRRSNIISDDKQYISEVRKVLKRMTGDVYFYIGFYDPIENVIEIPECEPEGFCGLRLPNANNLASLTVKTRKVQWFKEDEIKQLMYAGKTAVHESRAKQWLGLPLISTQKTIGLMAFQINEQGLSFSAETVNNLKLIGTTLSTIFESRIKTRELSDALQKAKESEKLKNGFLSNISHEIRTPMNAVIGFASMLYDDISEQERKEYLDLIINNGEQLLKTIDDIVDIAKIQSGEIKLCKVDVNLKSLLDKLYENYAKSPQVQSGKTKFEFDFPDDLKNLNITADPFRLRQALDNLLSNAFKFTEEGKVCFGVGMKNDERLEFFVQDTGMGIPQDKIDSVFEKFMQIEEGDIRNFGGNGLGLSITKSLVNLMNGDIYVESEPGKGTLVKITLPLDKEKFLKNGNGKKRAIPVYDWSDKKILLVDDVYSNLEFLDILLRRSKVKTIMADNGKKAVDIFKKDTDIDLVIMDLQMPVMDGYTATRLIKEINPNVPVIVQTAFTETSDKKLAFESGCDVYLEKPIRANVLLENIGKLI